MCKIINHDFFLEKGINKKIGTSIMFRVIYKLGFRRGAYKVCLSIPQIQ